MVNRAHPGRTEGAPCMGDMAREPSMEDILSSIRRVIARDEAPGSERAPRNSGDILDLRDEQADVPEAETAEAEELVSTSSADAARQSLEALSAAITPASAAPAPATPVPGGRTMEEVRSEEHTSELQSLMRNSYAGFCLKQKRNNKITHHQQL